MVLLEALQPGRYQAAGTYRPPAELNTRLLVEWTGTIVERGEPDHDSRQVSASNRSCGAPFCLALVLPAGLLKRGSFKLESSHSVKASGAFRALGGALCWWTGCGLRSNRQSDGGG
jgi:hypothetical protein